MESTNELFRNRRDIRREGKTLAMERLNFKNGARLGDLDMGSEKGLTIRKVRRIVEKRVNQNYWKNRSVRDNGNQSRYSNQHHVSNHMRNLYGRACA